MVVAGPTSSHLLRSFETSVHNSAFKCFVRTFRPLYLVGGWETAIAECHSVTGIRLKVFARFRYRRSVKLNLVKMVHDSFCCDIEKSGLAGTDLTNSFANVYCSLLKENVVDGWVEPRTLATFVPKGWDTSCQAELCPQGFQSVGIPGQVTSSESVSFASETHLRIFSAERFKLCAGDTRALLPARQQRITGRESYVEITS